MFTETAEEKKEDTSPAVDVAAASFFHPLEPLTKEEIAQAAALVFKEAAATSADADKEEQAPGLRFETIELKEPPKAVVRAYLQDQKNGSASSAPPAREAFVNVYKLGTIGVSSYTVNLTKSVITETTHHADVCPMIALEEFDEVEET